MYERFTDRAVRAVDLAKEQARDLGHDHVGTEHLLLGFLIEGECVAAKALGTLGVTRADVRSLVTREPSQAPRAGELPFTLWLKKTLELGLRDALQLGHPYIGTEHLLLGMARNYDARGMRTLATLGATGEQVRNAVIATLRGYEAAAAEPEPDEGDPVLRMIQARLDRIERHLDLPAL